MAEISIFPLECLSGWGPDPSAPGGFSEGMYITGHISVTLPFGYMLPWNFWYFISDFIPQGLNTTQIEDKIISGAIRGLEESPGPNHLPGWFVQQPGDKAILVGRINVVTI